MLILGSPFARPAGTLMSAIERVGLTSGLQLCLDAGDVNSYNGSSQTWSDVSGNSNHFYRGSGSGSDAADPTFNGAAGAQSSSEYFSSDGGDAFWQASSLTFMQAWHKNNAQFAVAGWVYMPAGETTKNYFVLRNVRDITDTGVLIGFTPLGGSVSGEGFLLVDNGSTEQYFFTEDSNKITEGGWMFFAASFSEGSGSSFFMYNGVADVVPDTFVSPSASNAPNGVSIWGTPDAAGTGLESDAVSKVPSGSRINSLAAWSGFLTQSQVSSLYNSTKGRFGL